VTVKLPEPDAGLSPNQQKKAEAFYRAFKEESSRRRLIFGFNRYAGPVLDSMPVDGIVDDFTTNSHINGLPVLRRAEIPDDALVLILAGGRPLTASNALESQGIEYLDYFAFQKVATERLPPLHFNEGFATDYRNNKHEYEYVLEKLSDDESRNIFSRLVHFRLTQDISHLEGFTDREKEQYFEPFLGLKPSSESFADVGGFDGYTSEIFSRLCPNFDHISLFEPDPKNMENAKERLQALPNVQFYKNGLGDKPGAFKLSANGSGSALSDSGDINVDVITLDSLDTPFSIIKIDIEGGELAAIRGARETIKKCHPKIAVAVYHYEEGSGPFWQIPKEILSIRNDYKLFLRHYTESLYETVMFFVPTECGAENEN